MGSQRTSVRTRSATEYAPGAQERLSATLGRRVTDRQVAGLVGAQPGERVSVDRYGQITAHAAGGTAFYAYLHRSAAGVTLWAAGYHRPGGLVDVAPTDAGRLATQVHTARALGISSLFTKATKAESLHLALLGWDSPLSAIIPHETSGARLPASLAHYQTLQALMRDPGGQAWWQRYGGTPGLHFDTRPRSDSMKQFARYRRGAP
jgi:hypothetical protein